MIIYHGSDHIIRKPLLELGKEDNDYGKGFYTTEDKEKANAWAVTNGNDHAYCNTYEIDPEKLNILRLDQRGPLAWIAEVVFHRGTISQEAQTTASLFVPKYKLDTSAFDAIVGYRADDSYTQIVDAFLLNQISADEVDHLFRKGRLGTQFFLKSQKAFDLIHFTNAEEVINPEQYVGYDRSARHEAMKFLNARRTQILLQGYSPAGITCRDAINRPYKYDPALQYYSED